MQNEVQFPNLGVHPIPQFIFEKLILIQECIAAYSFWITDGISGENHEVMLPILCLRPFAQQTVSQAIQQSPHH